VREHNLPFAAETDEPDQCAQPGTVRMQELEPEAVDVPLVQDEIFGPVLSFETFEDEDEAVSRATFEAVQRLNRLPIPTVALVQGGCFGGGTGVISACDVVIAADNAMFSITEVRWGLTAAIIIPQLCDAIGVRQVRRYALTGERFGAEEARRIGLVHEVVPLSDLQSMGAKIVEQLLANGPEALAETKALAMESSFGGMRVEDEAYARLVQIHAARRQTGEASEGLASFAEKRAANWRAVTS